MPKEFDLNRLFRRYPESPQMREAARCWARERTRTLSRGLPLTGAFYWVPTPSGSGQVTWEIQEFFDGWLPNSDHTTVWPHVCDYLAIHWNRNLRSTGYCGLPRGRVCRSRIRDSNQRLQEEIVIYHGGDGPRGTKLFHRVRQKFNLAHDCRIAWDDHERMLPADRASLSSKMGIDLKQALRSYITSTSRPVTARIFHA